MVRGILILISLSLLLISTFLFLQSEDTVSAELPVCLTCHKKLTEGKENLHPIILSGGCIACHSKPHSIKEKDKKFLFAQGVELCYSCHDKSKFMKKAIHPPVAGGQCTLCHDVHASKNRKLLLSDTPDLCLNCHDKSKFKDRVVHSPVGA